MLLPACESYPFEFWTGYQNLTIVLQSSNQFIPPHSQEFFISIKPVNSWHNLLLLETWRCKTCNQCISEKQITPACTENNIYSVICCSLSRLQVDDSTVIAWVDGEETTCLVRCTLPFDVVTGQYGDGTPTQLWCYLKLLYQDWLPLALLTYYCH